jgi:hypothetical protein
MKEHHWPKRGDEVEEWLKKRRDEIKGSHPMEAWTAIDEMLDDYRLAADTGQTLVALENNKRFTNE